METKILRFEDLRKYVSRIDPVVICRQETKEYITYRRIADVPNKFNSLYVYGMGISEFESDNPHSMTQGVEIRLSEQPRIDLLSDKEQAMRLQMYHSEKKGEERMVKVVAWLLKNNRLEDVHRLSADESYRELLIAEYVVRHGRKLSLHEALRLSETWVYIEQKGRHWNAYVDGVITMLDVSQLRLSVPDISLDFESYDKDWAAYKED